jgi:mannose-6-phosphate isomerase-like protein (cupin superfamily)
MMRLPATPASVVGGAADRCSSKQDLWFLDTRVIVRVSCFEGTDKISVLEHWAHFGDSAPLHIHRNQDEVFHCLAGELRFVVGGRELRARAGQTLMAPKGIAHTYRVESASGARWLIVTRGEDFERFVRAFSRPAGHDGLPEPSGPPTPEQAEALARACAQYGIDIVGPPLA